MKYKIFFAFLLAIISVKSQAQLIPRTQNNQNQTTAPVTQDVIYLKDSSIIKGQIIEATPERVKIELLGGSVLVYSMSQIIIIKKEIQPNTTNPAIINKPYHRRDTGMYHHIQTKLNMGMRNYGVSGGVGISYTGGYFINKYIGLGLTAGVERIGGYRFVPVLVDFRGYFTDNKTRFYYNLGAGYGFARAGYLQEWSKEVLSAKGGFYINPAIGVSFSARSRHHFTMDLGYSINKAEFQLRDTWDWGNLQPFTEKNTFYRWVLRLGWTF